MSTINKKIAIGAMWMLALRFSIKGISVVSTMILARLLTPDDFGLIAMASSVYALIELMRSFGFDTVLIQKQTSDRDHFDTAWTLQVLFSICSSILIISTSDLAAIYYNDTRLSPVLSLMAITILLSGLNNIGVVEFRKQLTFNKEFIYQLSIKLSGFFVTIPLAFYWHSYWAMLFGMLASNATSLILSFMMQRFRPKLTMKAWRDVLGFSAWLFINNVLFFINQHAQNFIIGKLKGSETLGLFTMSNEIATMITGEIVSPINRAAFPGYSALAHDKESLKKTYLNIISYISVIVCPAAIGMAAIACVFVPVLLGEKWLESITIIQIIALSSLLSAISTNAGYIYLAIKKQNITTATTIFYLSIYLPGMYFLLQQDSILGVAKAILICQIILYPLNQFIIKKYLGFSWTDYLSTIAKPFIAATTMGAIVFLHAINISSSAATSNFYDLLYLVTMGAIIYFIVLTLLWILSGKPSGIEHSFFTYIESKLIYLLKREL